MEQSGLMGQIVLTTTAFKAEPVEGSRFKIPKFKEVSANPMN